MKKLQKSPSSDSLTSSILAALLILLLLNPAHSAIEDLKGGASYLKLGMGAASTALGGCGAAQEGDATALYHNPAGLATVKGAEVHTMRDRLAADRAYNVIAGAVPTSYGTFALSWRSFSVDAVPITELDTTSQLTVDLDGNPIYEVKTTGYFSDRQSTMSLSWGKDFGKNLAVGATLKNYSHEMLEASGSGMGVDLGLLARVGDRIRLGLTVRDVNAIMKWDTASGQQDKLPSTVVLGSAWNVTPKLTALLDFSREQDRRMDVNFGIQAELAQVLALRAGLEGGNLTAGVGLKIAEGSFIDAAYRDEDLGSHYRLSATVRFDRFKKPQEKKNGESHSGPASGKSPASNDADSASSMIRARLLVNGRSYSLQNCLKEKNGTLLAPASFLTASSLARVSGPDANGLITLESDGHTLQVRVGDCNVLVDQKDWKMLSAPVQKFQDQLYVPVTETLRMAGLDSSVSLDSGRLY